MNSLVPFLPVQDALCTAASFDLLCGDTGLHHLLVSLFKLRQYVVLSESNVKLIIDVPCGYALKSLCELKEKNCKPIVATWNTCPEYLNDIQDLGCHVILNPLSFCHEQDFIQEIANVLYLASRNDTVYHTHYMKTELSPRERIILRYTAMGWKSKRIGEKVGIAEQTVKNYLRHIYNKIGINSQTEAIVYYWGLFPFDV